MDFLRVWAPYVYLYGAGGILFVVGLVMVLRSEAFDRKRASHRRWLVILLVGFVFYASLHLMGIFLALGSKEPGT